MTGAFCPTTSQPSSAGESQNSVAGLRPSCRQLPVRNLAWVMPELLGCQGRVGQRGCPSAARGGRMGSDASCCNPAFVSSGGTSPGHCPCSSGVCGSLAPSFQGETRSAVLPCPQHQHSSVTAPLPHPSAQWEPGELGPIQNSQCCLTPESLGLLHAA